MFLSRIELDADSTGVWESSTYSTHQMVWSWFSRGQDDKRSFLYRVDGDRQGVRILTLSEEPPAEQRGWKIETRRFAPVLRTGDRLAFSVRVNPTVSRGGRRHDVVMDLHRRLIAAGSEVPEPAELVQQAVTEWVAARAVRCGFEIRGGDLRADGYQRVHFRRKGMQVDFHQVEVEGVLYVTEPEALVAMLTQGIGKERGFGCGLMLVRRA